MSSKNVNILEDILQKNTFSILEDSGKANLNSLRTLCLKKKSKNFAQPSIKGYEEFVEEISILNEIKLGIESGILATETKNVESNKSYPFDAYLQVLVVELDNLMMFLICSQIWNLLNWLCERNLNYVKHQNGKDENYAEDEDSEDALNKKEQLGECCRMVSQIVRVCKEGEQMCSAFIQEAVLLHQTLKTMQMSAQLQKSPKSHYFNNILLLLQRNIHFFSKYSIITTHIITNDDNSSFSFFGKQFIPFLEYLENAYQILKIYSLFCLIISNIKHTIGLVQNIEIDSEINHFPILSFKNTLVYSC
jgi:hypothetical protein